jgi:hypothetical protein
MSERISRGSLPFSRPGTGDTGQTLIRGILFDNGNTLVGIRDGTTILKELLADVRQK